MRIENGIGLMEMDWRRKLHRHRMRQRRIRGYLSYADIALSKDWDTKYFSARYLLI